MPLSRINTSSMPTRHRTRTSKPSPPVALAGLYLHVEKGFSGREVQLAQGKLARRKGAWPSFPLPSLRGAITAADVLAGPPGEERNRAIDEWCASVWNAFRDPCREAVIDLLRRNGII